MKITCSLPYIFLCTLMFYGCSFKAEQVSDKRTTRSIFLGEHEETLSGVYFGEAFVSEHRLSFHQVLLLTRPVTWESEEIVDVPPYEGLTWIEAMVYCDMIRSNSVAKGVLKQGEVIRLPSVSEILAVSQGKPTSLWFFNNGISNGISPSVVGVEAVYEWTNEIGEEDPLSFIAFRHEHPGIDSEQLHSLNALQAYPNLIMRLVIAPEDEVSVIDRDIAKKMEHLIWKLVRKQHYNVFPFRGLGVPKSPDVSNADD